MLKKIIFEPLIHFLLLGMLFYLYYNSTQTQKVTLKTPIEISSQEIQQLKLHYPKDINNEVLQALIQKRYYEKVLLDKAYSIKLAQNDPAITKRLLQKMEFVMTDKSANNEPSEKELRKYYQNHIKDYSKISSLSFANIYFSNPHDTKLEETYKLLQISDVKAHNAQYFGDKSPLGNHTKNITFQRSQELYGRYFTSKLFTTKKGIWHKPIHSKQGVYLVYITDKNVTQEESFDDVQDRVYKDFLDERMRKIKKKSFETIASSYTLESDSIENP